MFTLVVCDQQCPFNRASENGGNNAIQLARSRFARYFAQLLLTNTSPFRVRTNRMLLSQYILQVQERR